MTFELEECYREERKGQKEEGEQMQGGMEVASSGSDSWIPGSMTESDRRCTSWVRSQGTLKDLLKAPGFTLKA